MGQGGRIIIINWTKYRLIQKKIKGTNMAEWSGNPKKCVPDLIEPYQCKRFYVQWSANIFKKAKEAKPKVVYHLEGMQNCIYIQGSSKPKYHFKVNWKDLQKIKGFWLFPFPQFPQEKENQYSFVEWNHDSYTLIAICDFQTTLNKYQRQPMIKQSKFPFWSESWMKQLSSIISDIRVRDLLIPGSVNSCASESYNYSKTSQKQSTTIYEQLNMGVRAFDLRVNFNPQIKGERRFLMKQINTEKSDCSLQMALKEIVKFLDRNNMEIVILDFSSLLSTWMQFDNMEFWQRLIPPQFKNSSIGNIWSFEYQRVIVSIGQGKFQHPRFWPVIYRLQNQEIMDSREKIQKFTDQIFKENQKKFPKLDLYSVIYEYQNMPLKQYTKKVNWVICPDSHLASLGNIIFVEQIHKTKCVNACVVGNILRQCQILVGKRHKEHINMRVKGDKFAPAFSYSDNDLDSGKDNDKFADDVKFPEDVKYKDDDVKSPDNDVCAQEQGQETKKDVKNAEDDSQFKKNSTNLQFIQLNNSDDDKFVIGKNQDYDSDVGVPDDQGFLG